MHVLVGYVNVQLQCTSSNRYVIVQGHLKTNTHVHCTTCSRINNSKIHMHSWRSVASDFVPCQFSG